MAKRQPIEIAFPFKGIDENWAFRRQPKGSSPDALNVRPYDVYDRRLRGGQRGGHAKYLADAVNGSEAIQALAQVVSALNPASVVADTALVGETFSTYGDGWLETVSSVAWTCQAELTPGSGGNGTNEPTMDDNATYPIVDDTNNYVDGVQSATQIGSAIHATETDPGTNYIIQIKFRFDSPNPSPNTISPRAGILFRVETDVSDGFPAVFQGYGFCGVELANTGTFTLHLRAGSETATSYVITYNAAFKAAEHTLRLVVAGNVMEAYLDGTLRCEHTSSNNNGQTKWGFVVGDGQSTGTAVYVTEVNAWTAVIPASLRTTHLLAIAGGDIYSGTPSAGLSLVPDGTDAVHTSRNPIGVQDAFSKLYTCDGEDTGYNYVDPVAHTITKWAEDTINNGSGMLPVGSSDATAYDITAATPGTPSFTVAEDLSALADGDIIEVASSVSNDGFYSVVSTSGSGPTVITVDQAVPDNDVTGSPVLTVRDLGCRMIALYRGRIVMSGLRTDPQNWFMSAVDDPTDWDYSPATTSDTQAVAGNASDAGKLGDVVTALVPYSDDLMIIGGDHTLWVMRGDPAAGGMIDNLSYQTGIAGSEAYAWDPEGNLYFFGSGALWKMGAGATSIENISRNRLDDTFGAINYATSNVRLVWDNGEKGLHLYFTPTTQPTTSPDHYFWDLRTGSFWKDNLPVTFGPTATLVYDADDPDDRAILLGGFDSYIQYIDIDGLDDDGTAIASYVDFTPIVLAGDLANTRLIELMSILAGDSSPVTLKVYASDSVENVLDETTPRYTRSLVAGRNSSLRQRVAGNAVRIRLQNEAVSLQSWAMESLTGLLLVAGKTRKGHL